MSGFVGTWHIYEMEKWDEDYFNMETQAYIEIQADGIGNFQFGLVSGYLSGDAYFVDDGARFEFTWEGSDELDPVTGSGWIARLDKDQVEGRITLHLGDSSKFRAERAD